MYVVYEKSKFDRLGKLVEDETNIANSDSVNGIITYFKNYRDLDVPKRTIYSAIKNKSLLDNKYYIYKIKIERE